MRTNLTITFDEGFIKWFDEVRGPYARGRYIEASLRGPAGRDIRAREAAHEVLGAAPVIERSPEPRVEFEEPREVSAAVGPMILTGRQIEEKRQAEAGEG